MVFQPRNRSGKFAEKTVPNYFLYPIQTTKEAIFRFDDLVDGVDRTELQLLAGAVRYLGGYLVLGGSLITISAVIYTILFLIQAVGFLDKALRK